MQTGRGGDGARKKKSESRCDAASSQASLLASPGCHLSPVWRDTKEMENPLCKHDPWPLLIQYSIRMTECRAAPPNPKTCAASGIVSIRPSRAGAVAGHSRWRGGEIEVSHVLHRDKRLNKMFLMAVRRRAICWDRLLRDDRMLARLQMLSQEVLEGEKLCLSPKISVTALVKKPHCYGERRGKGGLSCSPVISPAPYCTPGSLRLIHFP